MPRRTTLPVSILALLLALFPGPMAASEAAAGGPSDGLSEALAYAAPGTTFFAFTDWDSLKQAHGLEIVDSTLPEDVRMSGMMQLTADDAVFSGFGLAHLIGHAETWGWDSSDLAWDAQAIGSGPPVYVLHFRDDLDLGPFEALLDERGFDSRTYGGALIRSHELDLSADWIRSTELAINNTALLPDGQTLVMSGSPETLEAALDAGMDPEPATSSPAHRLAAGLGAVTSVVMDLGPGACTRYAGSPVADDAPLDAELLDEVGPLSHWTAMALATRRSTGGSAARMSFVFDDAQSAQAEVDARARLAREGHSLMDGRPYAAFLFEVLDASASDDMVSIDLAPVDGRSLPMVRALYSFDLLAAHCD